MKKIGAREGRHTAGMTETRPGLPVHRAPCVLQGKGMLNRSRFSFLREGAADRGRAWAGLSRPDPWRRRSSLWISASHGRATTWRAAGAELGMGYPPARLIHSGLGACFHANYTSTSRFHRDTSIAF